jgi:2-iminobutanoate/2-iminopropanoate deaminase
LRLNAPRPLVVVVACVAIVATVSSRQDRRILDTTAQVNTGTPGESVDPPAIVAGGYVYTSGLLGVDAIGRTDQPDAAAEARRALERLKSVVEAAGSSLGQVASVTVYLRNPRDFEAMNTVYREFFPDKAPARTTVGAELPHGAQVMISAIAVPLGTPREIFHPAGWAKSPRPYSYAVRAGDLVFLSGLVSRRGSDDQPVIGPVQVQTRTILENAGVLLRTAGLSYANVVAARVFLTDDSFFEAMNDEYGRYFSEGPPARATAVTRLMGDDSSVEISLIASASDKQLIGPTVSPSLPVSTAVRVGPRVFLSGVLGNTDANVGDVVAQTREALARIRRTLDTAGLDFADIVDSTVYLPDLWQYDRMDQIYRDIFLMRPARSTVGVKLVTRAGLVEFMTTAVK